MIKKVKNPNKYLGNELSYIQKVLESESWSATSGSWNQTLERKFCERIGSRYGIAMNSGTATLHCALEAAGVNPGDEVISPGMTVMMNTTATLHANAIPVYADINPDTFNIDPKSIESSISPRTKAIIAVGLYGQLPDMDPIMELAKRHRLTVIEDNAQCLLSTYKGHLAGTIGHIASFSFENTKHLSCGEGGMVTTNDEELAKMMRKIGGHGFKNLQAEEGRVRLNADLFQNPDYKRHDELGWNYRLPEFNAAIVLAQLERVEELTNLRIQTAKCFIDVMKETGFLIPQIVPEGYTNTYYTLAATYQGEQSIGVSWQDFRKAYVDAGGDGIYGAWSVPYLEPLMVEKKYVRRYPEIYKNLQYPEGICPVAERVQKQIMQFKTNYRDLTIAEHQAEILRTVIKNLSGR
jgi:perosamine synthetase